MPNALQPSARDAFARGEIDWEGDDLVVVLVDGDYEYSAAHEFLDEVPAGARVAVSDPLTGTTVAGGGVLDADDVVFATVAAGDTVEGLWVVQDTGTEATSRLIAWFDQDSADQMIHVATAGEDIEVVWSNGPTRIGRI